MLFTWILVGAFAGWLAGIITGSEDQGCAVNILVGMAGSLIGGTLERWLRTGVLELSLKYTDFSLSSLVVSFLGAILLLGFLSILKNIGK